MRPYYEHLVFRETFENDLSVAKNGWTKVGSGTIDNGLHGDGSTYLERDESFLPFSGSFTRRIKVNIASVASNYAGIYANNATAGFDIGIQGSVPNVFAFLRGGTSPATISDSHGGNFYGKEGQDVWMTWTKSAGGIARLYIDDVLESSSAATGAGLKPNSPIQVGARAGSFAIPSGYVIKELEEYDRELSAAEIADANAGTVYDIDSWDVDLPLYTSFNDGTNEVTRNFGTSGVNAIMGDGSTGAPDFLVPKGIKSDGSTQYLQGTVDVNDTKVFTFCGVMQYDTIPVSFKTWFEIGEYTSDGVMLGELNGTIFLYYNGASPVASTTAFTRQSLKSFIVSSDGDDIKVFINGELLTNVSVSAKANLNGNYSYGFLNRAAPSLGNRSAARGWNPRIRIGKSMTGIEAKKLHFELFNQLNI